MNDAIAMMRDDDIAMADFNNPKLFDYVKADFQKALKDRVDDLANIVNQLKSGLEKYDVNDANSLDLVLEDMYKIGYLAEDAQTDLAYFSLVFAKWHPASEKPRNAKKCSYDYLVRYQDSDGFHVESTWFDADSNQWQVGDNNTTILGWCKKPTTWHKVFSDD